MPQFTKKPVAIEAVQVSSVNSMSAMFDGPMPDWLETAIYGTVGQPGTIWIDRRIVPTKQDPMGEEGPQPVLLVGTLEGEHIASPGDWIIRGVKGELYPCKPDIFEMTYDPANLTSEALKQADAAFVEGAGDNALIAADPETWNKPGLIERGPPRHRLDGARGYAEGGYAAGRRTYPAADLLDPVKRAAIDAADAPRATQTQVIGHSTAVHDDDCDAGRKVLEIARRFISEQKIGARNHSGVTTLEYVRFVTAIADVVGYHQGEEN